MSNFPRYALFGWLDTADDASWHEAAQSPVPLSYLSPMGYKLEPSGRLLRPQHEKATLLSTLRRRGSRLLPTIENANEDCTWIRALASDTRVRSDSLNNLVKLAGETGVDGLTVRFQSLGPEGRDEFSDFIEELAWELHRLQKLLAVVVAPQVRDPQLDHTPDPHQDPQGWLQARGDSYDYRALSAYADLFIVESLNYVRHPQVIVNGLGTDNVPRLRYGPTEVTPIGWLHSVIQHALAHVPPRRLFFSLPLFGRRWSLTSDGEYGEPEILPLAHWQQRLSQVELDEAAMENAGADDNKLSFADSTGQRFTVVIDSVSSLAAKAQLVVQYDLGGIAFWRLGYGIPNVWHKIFEIIGTYAKGTNM